MAFISIAHNLATPPKSKL